MSSLGRPRTVLVTGANGYIGNAVARAFVRAGWITHGLIRSSKSAQALAGEEILPILGAIDDTDSHARISSQLPSTPGLLDVIVSTTEDHDDYVRHYENIVALLCHLSASSLARGGVKPLVIFTSGCKDYGSGPHFADDPNVAPHTEESPINPPAFAALRAEYSQKILEHKDLFSPVLVRPTNVHGRSSSYYGAFFKVAQQAAQSDSPLLLTAPPHSITHSMHVDDCGDAYVAIAEHARHRRDEIDGQVFNISGRAYETVQALGEALAAEYSISRGLRYRLADEGEDPDKNPWPPTVLDFAQWVGSEKLRRVTGWRDRRPLFTEAMHVYRMAYEAAQESAHENIGKVDKMFSNVLSSR